MRLTILGSGTSAPDGARNSASYFLEHGGVRMLMDCGAGAVHALARFAAPWESMTHIALSHYHVDHAGELAPLFQGLKYGMSRPRSEPLLLMGPVGLNRVMQGLEHAFGSELFRVKFPFETRIIAPGDVVALDDDTLFKVAKTPHTEESVAFRIEAGGRALCYTGDTAYSESLSGFFADADVLISECSFEESREGGLHLSIAEAGRLAARARAKKLVVTHFYFHVDEAKLITELRSQFSGEIVVGKDGDVIEIDD